MPKPQKNYLTLALGAIAILTFAWGLASAWFARDLRIEKLEWYHATEVGDYKKPEAK